MKTYKDYIFLKVPVEEWEDIEKKAIEQGREYRQLSYEDLLRFRLLYEQDIEDKKISAKEAHRRKKALKDMQIYKTLENYYTGLFRDDYERLTPSKLAELAGVNYRTARRFWNEYDLDKWIPKFESDIKALKEFLYQELPKSLVYSR